MAGRRDQYTALHEENPWEDSDWIPSDAEILLPRDRLEHLLLEVPVSDIYVDEVISVAPDDTVETALWRMRQRHVRALLVIEGEALVGIVSERDAVLHVEPGDTGAAMRVRDLMTPDPVLVGVDEPVGAAVQRFCVDGVHHLPVVDGSRGELVGVVALGQLVHALTATILNEEWVAGLD